jgi:MFS superfamily sulfate permease-like transporter
LPLISQEAIAVGRSFASIRGYKLDGNKEMLAMGFSNVAGSLSSCYVATGDHSNWCLCCNLLKEAKYVGCNV